MTEPHEARDTYGGMRPATLSDFLNFLALPPAADAEHERGNMFPRGVLLFATSLEGYQRAVERGGFRGRERGGERPGRPLRFAFPLRVDDQIPAIRASPFNDGTAVATLEASLRYYGENIAQVDHVLAGLLAKHPTEHRGKLYEQLHDAVDQYVDQAPYANILANPVEQQIYYREVQPAFTRYGIDPRVVDGLLDDFSQTGKAGIVVVLDRRMLARHGLEITAGDPGEEDCAVIADNVPFSTVIGVIPLSEYERAELYHISPSS